jgi:hypothetical protein
VSLGASTAGAFQFGLQHISELVDGLLLQGKARWVPVVQVLAIDTTLFCGAGIIAPRNLNFGLLWPLWRRAVLQNAEAQEHLTKLTTQLAASLQLGLDSSNHSTAAQGPEELVPLATAQQLPLITAYRPLFFYLLTEAAAAFSHIMLTVTLGFTSASTSAHATFYVRPGENNKRLSPAARSRAAMQDLCNHCDAN